MYVECNIVTPKHNQCSNENVGPPAACIVKIYVTANNIQILCVVQQCFHGEFISPATIIVLKSSCEQPDIFASF